MFRVTFPLPENKFPQTSGLVLARLEVRGLAWPAGPPAWASRSRTLVLVGRFSRKHLGKSDSSLICVDGRIQLLRALGLTGCLLPGLSAGAVLGSLEAAHVLCGVAPSLFKPALERIPLSSNPVHPVNLLAFLFCHQLDTALCFRRACLLRPGPPGNFPWDR